ncbi:MAG TPA: 50S ribosomal protein L15 [Nitrospiria bacterium]|nr:50S ribosomal protein L15 [Nitrospiria bacterium]
MRLDQLAPASGAKKKEKRIGRGIGSGHGKTSTKGHKGQGARSGGTKAPGFEGGQNPIIRRAPKRGFVNIFRQAPAVVNLDRLAGLDASQGVTPERLKAEGVIKASAQTVKILGDGTLSAPLTVQAHAFSRSAKEKIEAAGGKAVLIETATRG